MFLAATLVRWMEMGCGTGDSCMGCGTGVSGQHYFMLPSQQCQCAEVEQMMREKTLPSQNTIYVTLFYAVTNVIQPEVAV